MKNFISVSVMTIFLAGMLAMSYGLCMIVFGRPFWPGTCLAVSGLLVVTVSGFFLHTFHLTTEEGKLTPEDNKKRDEAMAAAAAAAAALAGQENGSEEKDCGSG
ncbi:MAG: hypothetical protein AAB389_03285 [Patescibacteria group bacterium]